MQAIARYEQLADLGGCPDVRLGRLCTYAHVATSSNHAQISSRDEHTLIVMNSSDQEELIDVDCCVSTLPRALHAVKRVVEVR